MKKIVLSVIAICLSAVLGIMFGLSKQTISSTDQRVYAQCIMEYSSFNELLEAADVVLIGSINDIIVHDQYDEYSIEVSKVYKGEANEEISIRNYLLDYYYVNNGQEYNGMTNVNYEVGKCYVFVLQYIENVYEKRYAILGDIYIPLDAVEDSTLMSQSIQDIADPIAYINDYEYNQKGEGELLSIDYIESNNMAEIVDFSPYIVEIEVLELYRTTEVTDVYLCRVIDAIKGSINTTEENTIIIPFFKNTVEPNGRYIVNLISDTADSLIYSLSTEYGVMNVSEKDDIRNVLHQN